MSLHGEIWSIDLEQKPLARDSFVLHPEGFGHGAHVLGERVVVLVLHPARNDARRRSGPERLDETVRFLLEDPAVFRELAIKRLPVDVAYRADGARRRGVQTFARVRLVKLAEGRIAGDILGRRTCTFAAETAHPV